MRKFDPDQFYALEEDPSIQSGTSDLVVQPKIDGMKLLIKYYEKKYRCQISLPVDIVLSNFVEKIKDWIAKLPNTGAQYRHAFILGMMSFHAIPVIYLRENGHQGILFADSMGVSAHESKEISKKIGIDVYIVDSIRQTDPFSCYTDALIFCKDTTAMNSENNEYVIRNLLSALKSRSEKKNGCFVTKLPNELLKTAQLSRFVIQNREAGVGRIIHKKETLDQFRERYTDKGVKMRFFEQPRDIANYVRKKGIKLADTIEIQFYLDELEKNTDVKFNENLRKTFISEAKTILKSQGSPPSRMGLDEYARDFLEKINTSDQLDGSDLPDTITPKNTQPKNSG